MEELSLYILDLVENALRAGATLVQVDILEDDKADQYVLTFTDNGAIIPKEEAGKIGDQNYVTTTSRKIGTGIASFKEIADMTEGTVTIDSEKNTGTIIRVSCKNSHSDRPELGDIEGTFALLIATNPQMDYIYNHVTPSGTFNLDTRDIKKLFVSNELNMPAVRHSIRGYIREHLNMIKAGI